MMFVNKVVTLQGDICILLASHLLETSHLLGGLAYREER